MSGDDQPPRDRRTERRDRTERSDDHGDDEADEAAGSARTRPEPPAGGDSGSSPTDALDDVPVSKSVLGGFATVLVLYVVLGLFLAIAGILFMNLYGGSLASGPLGNQFADAFLGFPIVTLFALGGPVLALPVGLWMGDGAESLLTAPVAAAVANGVGHFVMALLGAIFLAVEFTGLQIVDLIIPYLFASVFAAVLAGVAAAASAYLS